MKTHGDLCGDFVEIVVAFREKLHIKMLHKKNGSKLKQNVTVSDASLPAAHVVVNHRRHR